MNARNFIQSSLIAALMAAGAAAHAAPAGEGDTLADRPVQVQSGSSLAASQAASLATAPRSASFTQGDGYGGGAQAAAAGGALDRAAVRQAAIRAERAGQIEHGDAITF